MRVEQGTTVVDDLEVGDTFLLENELYMIGTEGHGDPITVRLSDGTKFDVTGETHVTPVSAIVDPVRVKIGTLANGQTYQQYNSIYMVLRAFRDDRVEVLNLGSGSIGHVVKDCLVLAHPYIAKTR